MAITLAPGQIVASSEWDALFTQHGGMPNTTQAVQRSRSKAEIEAAALAGDDDPAAQQRPIYRYVLADGSYVDARTSKDGAGWEVIDYKPSQKFTQDPANKPPTAATTPGRSEPDKEQVEGTPDGQGGYDNSRPVMASYWPDGRVTRRPLTEPERLRWERDKNGGKTEAEIRTEQQDRIGKPTGNTRTKSANGTTVKETEYLLPDGTKEWRSQTETDQPDLVGKPTGNSRQRNQNGQVIKEAEYVLADGTKEWRSQTAPADDRGAYGVEPASAPPMATDPGQVTAGLRTYSSYLSTEVKKWKDWQKAGGAGTPQGISPDEATKLMDRRLALAESAVKEREGLESTQTSLLGNATTQRGQTLQDTSGRRSAASSILNNTINQFVPLATKLGPGGGPLLSAAINDTLRSGIDYTRAFGGLRESPEVGVDSFPALAAARAASMAGINTAAAGGPQIFQPRPVTGAVPPVAPAAAGGVDPAAAAADRASQEAGAAQLAAGQMPSLMVPPAAAAPAPSVPVADNPMTGTPITMPAAAQGVAPMTDEQRRQLDPGNVQGIADTTGSLINSALPPVQNQAPIEMPQGIDLSTPLQDPGTGPVGMMPRFVQEARYGQGQWFDPDEQGNLLAQRLGISPEIMAAAARRMYG